ncbi:TatD family hydrolase [Chlorobium phaeobacteroides]|jgi:TatD DNase family protein|uniref:Hydrolase, TatD family n=1 Tax=Chlorobium phaeobacteroides (strain DSM 266 / SMG 266 / 2430) TaxID=290317 RepID=A1BED4_CHLPD|nr:TatD family hydrolase [Chlorobium phaeobacteroides]ABL64761.1 hydrolase, TatD family [Chlorobium phaeobacteroides DSM 266]MBV5319403.1 TatD family hydrolase [Chlorobium phaeobacteroides]
MFIDAHCHLSFPEFDQDRSEVIERLNAGGISLLIDPGTNSDTSRKAIELASSHTFIYANVGLHPHEVTDTVNDSLINDLALLARSPKVVGIGEIGLDYHYPGYNRTAQMDAFRRMLNLAKMLDLPAVIHCRDAWDDMLRILDDEKHSSLRGVMHCFSGDTALAGECLRRGFKLSIPGTVTYKRSLLPEVIDSVSLHDLLTETDAPYLAPIPHRGKRNEPAFVQLVTQTIASIKNIPLDDAADAIESTARQLFQLA